MENNLQGKLGVFILVASILALTPISVLAEVANCQGALKEVRYSARFTSKKNAEALRIEIGSAGNSRKLSALIRAESGHCYASCTVLRFDQIGPIDPVSMDLECRDAAFDPLSSHAALVWSTTRPLLRFGTWLGGYRNFPLQVELDSFSVPREQKRKLAELATPRLKPDLQRSIR